VLELRPDARSTVCGRHGRSASSLYMLCAPILASSYSTRGASCYGRSLGVECRCCLGGHGRTFGRSGAGRFHCLHLISLHGFPPREWLLPEGHGERPSVVQTRRSFGEQKNFDSCHFSHRTRNFSARTSAFGRPDVYAGTSTVNARLGIFCIDMRISTSSGTPIQRLSLCKLGDN
jgi:hypothetical protein